MKNGLLIIFLLVAGMMAQSQVLITLLLGDKLNSDGLEFGLEGGINWTKISGLDTEDYARKWNLGFYFDIRIKNQWSLSTGVLVKSNFGVDKLSDNDLISIGATNYNNLDTTTLVGDYSMKISSFMVPVLIRYKFINHIYVELGPQFSLMYNSWVEFESDIEGRDATIKEYNRDKINKIDVGIMIGTGYRLFKGTGWTIGAKYYYGFVDVFKDVPNTKNSSIYLKLNIPIGAGEVAQQKSAEKAAKKKEKKSNKKNKK
ncbi:MAG: porin family protein [Bacteroidota bacterium]